MAQIAEERKEPSSCHSKFKKRNKNSRFISNAKGFGKRGLFGRGAQIEQDQFTYFINILDVLKQTFQSIDEKVSMTNNVFEQTIDKEVQLSSNQVVSKVIENLIGFTGPTQFERFLVAYASNFRPICSDGFASHILQKIIEICFLRATRWEDENSEKDCELIQKRLKLDPFSEVVYNNTREFSEEHRKFCSEFVVKIGKFLLNNLEDFLWDPCGSHIMQTCILSLAGIHDSKVSFEKNNNPEKHGKAAKVPDSWTEVVREFACRLQMWPQFSDLPSNSLSSSVLAIISIALRAFDKSMLKHFGKKILVDSFLKNYNIEDKKDGVHIVIDGINVEGEGGNSLEVMLPNVFLKESSIRLLETLLSIAGPKLFTQLNVMLFTGRVRMLALERKTNFAIQKLIENAKEKSEFEAIFEEIHDSLEEILRVGHTGVVTAIARSCKRLSTKQGAFVSSLQTALHIPVVSKRPDAFVVCILKLKPYEIAIEDKTPFIHLHGSMILQSMLEFSKPIKLVQCLLAIPSQDLVAILCTPNGSYIADSFIQSKSIGEKSREKLLKHMEGYYLEMATTKFGSRVVENFYQIGNEGQKTRIVQELSEKVNRLNGTLFGRVLYQKFRIATYVLSVSQWKASVNKANKVHKLFDNIIK